MIFRTAFGFQVAVGFLLAILPAGFARWLCSGLFLLLSSFLVLLPAFCGKGESPCQPPSNRVRSSKTR